MNKTDIDLGAVKYSRWYEWEHTFVFFPERDVNGKLIFGRVWKRERYGSIAGVLDPKTYLTPIYSLTQIEYAGKKEMFIRKLQDEML